MSATLKGLQNESKPWIVSGYYKDEDNILTNNKYTSYFLKSDEEKESALYYIFDSVCEELSDSVDNNPRSRKYMIDVDANSRCVTACEYRNDIMYPVSKYEYCKWEEIE